MNTIGRSRSQPFNDSVTETTSQRVVRFAIAAEATDPRAGIFCDLGVLGVVLVVIGHGIRLAVDNVGIAAD